MDNKINCKAKKSIKCISFDPDAIEIQSLAMSFYVFKISMKFEGEKSQVWKDQLLDYLQIDKQYRYQCTNKVFSDLRNKDSFQLSFSFNNDELNIVGLIWSSSDPDNLITNFYKSLKQNYGTIYINPHNQQASVIADGIKKMGFKNTKEMKDAKKVTYLYAINDNGNDCIKEWATFPVLVAITKNILDLRVVFAINSKPGIFSNEKIAQVQDFIFKTNRLLTGFSFHYDKNRKHTYMKTTQWLLNPPEYNFKLPQKITSEAVHTYTSFGYGLYAIYSSSDALEAKKINQVNEKLLKKCLQRNSKPTTKFSLIINAGPNIKQFSDSVGIDIGKEKALISMMETKRKLAEIFLIDKVQFIKDESQENQKSSKKIAHKGIKYPKFQHKAAMKQLADFLQFVDQEMLATHANEDILNSRDFDILPPEVIESLFYMIQSLSEIDLMIKKEKIRTCFQILDKKIYYNFKYPFQNVLIEDREKIQFQKIQDYLLEILLTNNNSPWFTEDIFFSKGVYESLTAFIDNDYRINQEKNDSVIEFKRYGMILTIERIINQQKLNKIKQYWREMIKTSKDIKYTQFKDKNEMVEDKAFSQDYFSSYSTLAQDEEIKIKIEASDRSGSRKKLLDKNRLREVSEIQKIKAITTERYHLNQFFQNKFMIRYLGLLDDFTIISGKVITDKSFDKLSELSKKINISDSKEQEIILSGLSVILSEHDFEEQGIKIIENFEELDKLFRSKGYKLPGVMKNKIYYLAESLEIQLHIIPKSEMSVKGNIPFIKDFFDVNPRNSYITYETIFSSYTRLMNLLFVGDPRDANNMMRLFPKVNERLSNFGRYQ